MATGMNMSDATDQYNPGQQQQQQKHWQEDQRYISHPTLAISSTNYDHQDTTATATATTADEQYQQQQKEFLLSVLLLQQNLQQRQQFRHQQQDPQQQQQQQQQQGLRQLNPPTDRSQLPSDIGSGPIPSTHLQVVSPQPGPPPTAVTIAPPHLVSQEQQENPPQHQYHHACNNEDQQQQDHQRQSQYQIGSWTEPIASLIQAAGEPRKQRLKGLRVVTARLDRRSLAQPWGIAFVSISNQNLAPNRNNIVPNTSTNHVHDDATTSLLFGRRVIVVKSPPSPKDCPSGIFPGDIMLAIDGRPVSSWCTNINANINTTASIRQQRPQNNSNSDSDSNSNNGNTTAEIASYLRSIRTVSIVVLRHTNIVRASAVAAASHTFVTTSGSGRHDPYRISTLANQAWNQLLVPWSLIATAAAKPYPTLLPGKPRTYTPAHVQKHKPKASIVYRNPWFWQENENGIKTNIPYDDNKGSSIDYELYLQEDGTRASLFLPPIASMKSDFEEWLSKRKTTWRSRYKVYQLAGSKKTKPKKKAHEHKLKLKAKPIPKKKEDSSDSENPVSNADFWTHQGFSSFHEWLRHRSISWQRSYSWNKRTRQKIEEECFEKVVCLPSTLLLVGISSSVSSASASSDHHHSTSSSSCSAEEFHEWLKARRVQWRMSRRKRKRQRLLSLDQSDHNRDGHRDNEQAHGSTSTHASPALSTFYEDEDSNSRPFGNSGSPRCVTSFTSPGETMGGNADANANTHAARDTAKPTLGKRKLQFLSEENQQMAFIDEILEEKEKEKEELLRKRAERPPIDIGRFFDATQGIPDDVVAHCFAYLDPKEHGTLLVIDKAIAKSLQDRHGVWQMLCPAHWVLPRRPRKPWHELYLTRLRKERVMHQKRWDDLLLKCAAALFKRDDLQKVEKLITKAQKDFGFDLNYASGVVCERNSILNLAVIHGRYKVVKWLVDTKHADIETSDRGNFTPLLNAAWSGNRGLVRYFLQRRSNRYTRGTQHYTQGIAPPGFEGKTAEEWALYRKHPEVAKLIRLGL